MARSLKSQHIRLGTHTIRVHVDDNLCERENLFGRVYFHENLIEVAGDVAITQTVCALLHEMAHFMIEGCVGNKKEESVVEAIERGLASLLRDNPKLIRTILEIFEAEEIKCRVKSKHKHKWTMGTRARVRRATRRRARRT